MVVCLLLSFKHRFVADWDCYRYIITYPFGRRDIIQVTELKGSLGARHKEFLGRRLRNIHGVLDQQNSETTFNNIYFQVKDDDSEEYWENEE